MELVAATVPIAVFKNAIRITVLAPKGGLVFTPLAVVLLVLLLMALQKSEVWFAMRRQGARGIPADTPESAPAGTPM